MSMVCVYQMTIWYTGKPPTGKTNEKWQTIGKTNKRPQTIDKMNERWQTIGKTKQKTTDHWQNDTLFEYQSKRCWRVASDKK